MKLPFRRRGSAPRRPRWLLGVLPGALAAACAWLHHEDQEESQEAHEPPIAGCTRLLPGPLGDGVAWEIASPWHSQALPTCRPESGLAPLLRCDFTGREGEPPEGWLVHEALARFVRPEAATAPLPVVRGGHLELPSRESLALRVVPVPPLTPCVVTLRVRQPESAAGEVRLLVADLTEDPSSLRDPIAIAERIESGGIVTTQREIGRDLAPRDANDATRRLEPELLGRDADGFETWRVELSSEWGARALLLAAFGSASGSEPVALDDVTLHVLPARRLLALPSGPLFTALFDLPRPWENLDPKLRVTKVRCDWESRRALLLPRGSVARCRVARPGGGAALELGFAIVREERLTIAGPHRELVHLRVGTERRDVKLELRADVPSLWRDLSLSIAAAAGSSANSGDPWIDVEISVAGEDVPDGALVAVSDPRLYGRPPALAPGPRMGTGPGTETEAPLNLLVISLDTMRADRLGRRRDGQSLTPALDALAGQSAAFSAALANASYTLPSHVSMFTSQRPGEHGVLTVFDELSPDRSANLAEIAARHGFTTAAFTSGGMLNAEFCGIDRGFDRFGEIDPLLTPGDRLRRIAPLRDRAGYNRALAAANRLDRTALPWLRDHRGVPFVLLLHTYLVHNYQPEPELAAEFTRTLPPTPFKLTGPIAYRKLLNDGWRLGPGLGDDRFEFVGDGAHEFTPERDLPWVEELYDATVAQADRDVGRILAELDALGLTEKTIVVVTSDHGEEFLEHGDLSHARTLFDEILRVPLLIRVPGAAPRAVAEPVELIDLAPTLLARMGLPVDRRMRGADLLASDWEPRAVTVHEGVEGGAAHDGATEPKTLRAARSRGCKLVVLSRAQRPADGAQSLDVLAQLRALGYVGGGVAAGGFFDLESDPGEQKDLAAGDALTPAQRSRLQQLWQELERP